MEGLRGLGAWSMEQIYDAQVAAALVEMPPEVERYPFRRVLQCSVSEAAAAHWSVKSHHCHQGLSDKETFGRWAGHRGS